MANRLNAGALSASRSLPIRAIAWRNRLIALLLGLLFVGLVTVALAVQWPLTGRYNLAPGDVAPADIRAPRYIAYISASLTEEARRQAERRVAEVVEPQPRARINQVQRARELLASIEALRLNDALTDRQKLETLRALPDGSLPDEAWQRILALDEESWARVKDQVPVALNTMMLGEIRESQLPAMQRRAPAYLDLTEEDEVQAATALVQILLRPTMVVNAERTAALRQEARNAVLPQTVSYEANEVIVRQGDIVTQQHVEALEALGLNEPQWDRWQLVRSLAIGLVMGLVMGLYFLRYAPAMVGQPRRLALLLALLGGFLALAVLMVPNRTVFPYVFPLAALSMLVTPLLGVGLALLVLVFFGVILAFLSGGDAAVVAYALLGSLVGAFILGRADRTSSFVRAGAAVALTNVALVTALHLRQDSMDLTGYLQLVAAAVVNGGLAASIALIGFYLLGAIFDIATPLRLMELARPNHPLLQDLIMKAPGTYHHSLLVSNLGEQAAEAIGADAFLTRVGAYYHDVGKITRPYFFVENRLEGASPHDQLDPWSSAQIIISHVRDGLELARRYRLPRRIRDFIAEHQGTGLVRYFYHEAQKLAGPDGVDEKDFRYPGPRPQSKETAILMLADSCESAVRGEHPETRQAVEAVVNRVVNQKLMEGELADSDLTLRELETVRQVLVRALQGLHHPRVKYPEGVAQPAATAAAVNGQQPAAAEGKAAQPSVSSSEPADVTPR